MTKTKIKKWMEKIHKLEKEIKASEPPDDILYKQRRTVLTHLAQAEAQLLDMKNSPFLEIPEKSYYYAIFIGHPQWPHLKFVESTINIDDYETPEQAIPDIIYRNGQFWMEADKEHASKILLLLTIKKGSKSLTTKQEIVKEKTEKFLLECKRALEDKKG